MPRQGQSVESCIINEWHVQENDVVNKGDILCEVETDKATFEVESTTSGTILSLLYPVDADVEVLRPIVIIGNPDDDISEWIGSANAEHKDDQQKESGEKKIKKPLIKTNHSEKPAILPLDKMPSKNTASPRAKKLANEKNVYISSLHGSGPYGRVIARDVINASENSVAVAEDYLGPHEAIPAKGIRKIVAERMLASLHESAQLTINSSADARRILDLRKLFKQSSKEKLNSISLNDIILYAAIQTLIKFPELNAHWRQNQLIKYESIHIGFAVDTPRGLMVPVIKNAHNMDLCEISQNAKNLASKCLNGTINPDDLTGATFTITNLGSLGIESFTPVLNLPEVAILGVCSIALKPILKDDEIYHIPHIGLSLTFNHCALDGAPSARFLSSLRNNLYRIDEMLSRGIF